MNLAVIAIIPALFAISLTNAWTQASCSLASLKGQYVFTGRGFIEAVQPGVQRMHYGVFVFDGTGKFAGKQSSSRAGKIGREKIEGAYTLDSDCTGTMTFGRHHGPIEKCALGFVSDGAT